MQGLLLKLSALDADAENAVRVIGFFDRLITSRASLDVVLRSTAALAECTAGISAPARGLSLQANAATGTSGSTSIPPGATIRELPGGAIVWISRTGPAAQLDDILLERFAIAVAALLEDPVTPVPTLGESALVSLIVAEGTGAAERSRALHLLGIDPASQLRVVAVSGDGRVLGPSVQVGQVRAVLVSGQKPSSTGARSGIGPCVSALDAARSWRAAYTAWRLTSVAEPVLWAEELGSVVALAERLTQADLAQIADVAALERLSSDTIRMLEALCRNASARQAAAALHRHHSTLPARIAQAESALGFDLKTPAGRFRLHLALMLLRLRDSEDLSV